MAIAFRSAGTLGESDSTSTLSVSYTLTAGDLLCVIIEFGKATTPNAPTSVKWNTSESMSIVGAVARQSTFRTLALYQLTGATSGSHNIDIVMDSTMNVLAAVAFGYSGVDTTTPFITAGEDNQGAFSTAPSATATSVTSGNLVLGVILSGQDGSTLTMTNGTLQNTGTPTANVGSYICDRSSSGSVQINGSFTNTVWAMKAVEMKAAATGWGPLLGQHRDRLVMVA